MWDHEIKAMASAHAVMASSVCAATVLPAVVVRGFSVYSAHLLWLYAVSGAVAAATATALETFSLAVLLTSLTTVRCLCVLGPNVQAWIRVFSRHGAMSVWDTSLQITVACSVIAWDEGM
ncbi:hypothetical protein CRUP_021673 [Coryphaenoides rupestris]|nr:hypothetical protein CRUP_021673 [Coryphaenoides rupestris]